MSSNALPSSHPTTTTTSSLRPRTRRLISGLDEGDETNFDTISAASTRTASPLLSPLDSRSASPIPSARLPRPSSSRGLRGGGTKGGRAGNESPNSLSGLWGSSWTALQGIASDLLSGDAVVDAKDKSGRVRRPVQKQQGWRSSTSAPPGQWGPGVRPNAGSVTIGGGHRDEQLAALRAQKRKDMLTRSDTSYADTLGKFKRRLSDDRASLSAPPGDNEDRDALVYLHHVQKDDTLAGITIRYNCSANTLRKANRMWPNDPVHSRDILILPVDACSVKGKMMPGPEALDLLSTDAEALEAGQAEEVNAPPTTNGDISTRNRTNSSSTTSTSRRASSSTARSSLDTSAEQPWHHDSWVLLPGATKPTEIARLSRKALGYFPPTRRKNTPSTSLDLTRTMTTEQLLALSPSRQDPPQRPARTRRLSNANNGYFPAYLAGPGGVGTMQRNVRFPGPAQDGLNKMFAKHLPDVAPPRQQQNLLTPEMPLYTDDGGVITPMASGATSPNLMMMGSGNGVSVGEMAGGIENWMRRMASNAKDAMAPPERVKAARASVGAPGKGAGGVGDLIEMIDGFEIGEDEFDDHESGRGRQGSVVHVGLEAAGSGTSGFGDVGGVRERSMGGKGGKDD
ncbi:hypothetical protein LTR56_003790 [Elasticomyces elasticus]|nr:hypothetical protein LTR22_013151 [Elasticomyces elasticus]KAK3654932.1 hypothetical protein LTR56_003790 [Elasticomyces elasticus]KAK5766635.1 hypothetical protein LTS12_003254 [Elasticomyces elasticus]